MSEASDTGPTPSRGRASPRVTVDERAGEVTVDGLVVPGWVDDETCGTCGEHRIYHERYDSYFCPRCNAWLEEPCGDASCSYCPGRPAEPLGTERGD